MGNYFLPFGARDEATGRIHYFGTDNIGRDYFTRIIYAGRISLTVALTAVLISTLIGVAVGAYAGYYGGWVDSLLMRFVDFMLTIPFLPLLLILSSMLLRNENLIPIPDVILRGAGAVMLLDVRDARQAVIIIIVLAATGWLQAARLMRGTVLSLRNQTFTEAARAMGASNGRIILSHMIPNSMAPIIVDATLALAGFIILEAALSFLGFGIQDPVPTWGNMLASHPNFHVRPPLAAAHSRHPHLSVRPGVQLHRRWSARCAGPTAEALIHILRGFSCDRNRSSTPARGQEPQNLFFHRRRRGQSC